MTVQGSDGVEPPPPTEPKSGVAPDDQYSLNKLAPIIVPSKRAVTVEDPGDVGGGTTINPKPGRAGLAPDDQFSLNGGSIIKIIVTSKRAATIQSGDPVEPGGGKDGLK